MGFFDFTGLAGPVPHRVLPFTPELALQSAVLGAALASLVGILWASLRRRRPRRAPSPAFEPLRLVVPARPER